MFVRILFIALSLAVATAAAAGTAFTYQGELTDLGQPISNSADLRFELFDTENGGAPVATTVEVSDVAVENGRFTVLVDFGSAFDGDPRWLEISARTPHDPAGTEPFTTLAPRQPITPVPYATHAANAGPAAGNTLDQAYDQGGPGAGRSITADAGPVRIDSGQLVVDEKIGIGTPSPLVSLHVYAGTDVSPAGGGFARFGASGAPNIAIDNNEIMARTASGVSNLVLNHNGGDLIVNGAGDGRLGVGTTNPTQSLHVNGGVHLSGTNQDLSWPPGERLQVGTWDGANFVEYMELREDSGAPALRIKGANGDTNVRLRAYSSSYPNNGSASVHGPDGLPRAGMYVDSSGQGVVWGDIKNFRVDNPRDPDTEIWYASLEGPEAAAYLRGTARLTGGHAVVALPEHFRDVVIDERMTVQLTPRSADSLGLAVVAQSGEQFTVRELLDGTGDYPFDWEVMAVRDGYADYQVIRPRPAAEFPSPAPDDLTDAELRSTRAARAGEVDND